MKNKMDNSSKTIKNLDLNQVELKTKNKNSKHFLEPPLENSNNLVKYIRKRLKNILPTEP